MTPFPTERADARRRIMFSPILAMVSAIAVRDRGAADFRRLDLFEIGSDGERHFGNLLHQPLKQLVASDKIGLRIDLDDDALRAPDRQLR